MYIHTHTHTHKETQMRMLLHRISRVLEHKHVEQKYKLYKDRKVK